MEWLSQNWIWLALLAGVVLLFSRGRHGAMGGCGHAMAHDGPHESHKPAESEDSRSPRPAKEGAPGGNSAHRHRGGCC
jgi:hypothetical protein